MSKKISFTRACEIYEQTSARQGEVAEHLERDDCLQDEWGSWVLKTPAGRVVAEITAGGHCVAGARLNAANYRETEQQRDWVRVRELRK